MDILRRIPNLRKISMSPLGGRRTRARESIGRDFVFSCKPNPALLAEDAGGLGWRADLRDALDKARGCHVEIIMKDISTVRYQPQRLWEWAAMAMELAEAFAP